LSCKDWRIAPTNEQAGISNKGPIQSNPFQHLEIMKIPIDPFYRGYKLLVSGGNFLQSPFLLLLRVYFFWQLFQTGQGKLAQIGNIADYFASLGIPLPTLNAYMAGATETFGSLLLIIGLASRLTAMPITVVMAVAYLTADLEAVTGIFSDPDKFVKADPFPYLISALIVLVFGPGKFSIDALIKRVVTASRRPLTQRSQFVGASVPSAGAKVQN
jgi:putative oxidoreductase